MIAGIERLNIVGGNRIEHHKNMDKQQQPMKPAVNDLYREHFALINSWENVETVLVTSEEAKRDMIYGIDVVLNTIDGRRITVQEKLLSWHEDTLTIQVQSCEGRLGTWYSCTADLYLVAYAKNSKRTDQLRSWILVDRPKLKQWKNLPWQRQPNNNDGKVIFDFLPFDLVPGKCVVARTI